MNPANSTFEAFAGLWQKRYHSARGGGPNVRETEDFINKKQESEEVFQFLKPLGDPFLNLVKGLDFGSSSRERAIADVICFFPKFFKVSCIEQLPPAARKKLDHAIDETYFLGLASHLILFNHPSRGRIKFLNKDAIFSRLIEVAGVADVKLKAYNKDVNGMPEAVFLEQFSHAVQPVLKNELTVGFWKMGKLRSHFRNIFFAATILGVLADTQAADI